MSLRTRGRTRTAGLIAAALCAATTIVAGAQRVPFVPYSDLPIGLGIARVPPIAGGVLAFYAQPRLGDRPDTVSPVDEVRFRPGVPSVEIAEAPPWLVPERLKLDYELFELRVVSLTREWVEVIGNMRTGETWWVDRSAVQFMAWPEYLLGAAGVRVLDAEGNPVRVRPFDISDAMATTTASLPPLGVQGDWLQVSTGHLADRMPPEGWIRWRRGDRLLVSIDPLS